MRYWQGLEVKMLGGFEMNFEGQPLLLNMKQNSKPLQLLQLLLDSREAGVSRRTVIDALFGQETEIDAANSLNVTAFRLRKLLQESILPKENYIRVRIDRYFFECSFPVWVDTEQAVRLRQAADLATGNDRRSLLYQLCDLYNGRFLPDLDGEDWAEIARAHYHRIFRGSMEDLCHALAAEQAYTELLRLTEFAAKVFPFDEWQVWQQESLLALGRHQEAQALYRSVEKLYLSELDAPPPEQMRSALRLEREPWRKAETPQDIRERLNSEAAAGPTYFPLVGYMSVYRLLSQSGGPPPGCLLCTLNGGSGRAAPEPGLFHQAMEQLEQVITAVLTPSDAYTRYSRSQFLILLPAGTARAAHIISAVMTGFAAQNENPRLHPDCQILSGD